MCFNEEQSIKDKVDDYKETMDKDHVAYDDDNSSGTGIVIRTRENPILSSSIPFQGTASRRIRLQKKLQLGFIRKPMKLDTSEEESSVTEVRFQILFFTCSNFVSICIIVDLNLACTGKGTR